MDPNNRLIYTRTVGTGAHSMLRLVAARRATVLRCIKLSPERRRSGEYDPPT